MQLESTSVLIYFCHFFKFFYYFDCSYNYYSLTIKGRVTSWYRQFMVAFMLVSALMCNFLICASLGAITVNTVKSALKHCVNFQTRKLLYRWYLLRSRYILYISAWISLISTTVHHFCIHRWNSSHKYISSMKGSTLLYIWPGYTTVYYVSHQTMQRKRAIQRRRKSWT